MGRSSHRRYSLSRATDREILDFARTEERVIITLDSDFHTLIEQKSRMLQIQGVEGEAVVDYAEPLATKEMGCDRLSHRVKDMAVFLSFLDITNR